MRLGLVIACVAGPVLAQAEDATPLSAIDWLDNLPAQVVVSPFDEPSVTETATTPKISVQPLARAGARRVGLVPGDITGLPDTLWAASTGVALAQQIEEMPQPRMPAMQGLLSTLLVAETNPPASDAHVFDVARVDTLTRLGALDAALALTEQAGPERDAALFARYMDLSLLAGTENNACGVLQARPRLSPSRAHEVFCTARAGDWDTAVLVLGTARVLGLLPDETAAALERFLDPDLFEGEPNLVPPADLDPLLFRLFAAVGTPVPTRALPVIYANTDLTDTVGWKARIEAAERLARNGVLPDNRLLGLYSMRAPAASGGVWDRVAALQRFETALETGSADAIARTLPDAYARMREVRLAVPFARLFAEPLMQATPTGRTADVAFELALLSSAYEAAPRALPARARARPILAAVATGDVPSSLTALGVEGAILDAFRDAPADPALLARARDGNLGQALLATIMLTEEGAAGDVQRLRTGLATLRALGLEDVARRTALQILLLRDTA